MLCKVFGPSKEEGGEMLRWVEHAARMGGTRNAYYKILVRKPEAKRQLGRSRCRWEGSLKLDFKTNKVSWYELDSAGPR